MKRTTIAIVVPFVLVLALSVVGIAQQQKSTATGQKTEAQPGMMQMGNMMNMMEECRKHCQATSSTIDQLNNTIDEAKRSNDAAKMRAALESMQKPLLDMKNHMSTCMSNMDMMKQMPGGTTEGQKNKLPEKK